MIHIDAYRIGYPWRIRRHHTGGLAHRSSDRWRRCWQAEWDGCQRAVRAWTERGVLRKASRTIAVEAEKQETRR